MAMLFYLTTQRIQLYLIEFQNMKKRSIEEPQAESVVIGSREGFIESIGTNLSMVRRKIKTPSLKMMQSESGTYSHTSIFISYIEGIAKPEIVEEVKKRLKTIDVDAILSNAAIEEAIEDTWYSPFPSPIDKDQK